jgi:hypothetical protein
MLYAGYLFVISSVLFIAMTLVITLENKSNRRFVLTSTRDRLDSGILYVNAVIRAKYALILKRSLKLSWYYSLHTMLKAVMGLLVHSYDRLEQVVINNRARAKKVRAESRVLLQDNHLAEIEKHKQDTALTSKQKKKLRAEKLERD